MLAHKLRSLLTMLGLIMSVGGIVGLVGIGESVKGVLMGQLDNIIGGANMFGVFRPPFFFEKGKLTPNRSSEYLTYEDAIALENQSQHIAHVIPQVSKNLRVSVGFAGRHVDVMGKTPVFRPA